MLLAFIIITILPLRYLSNIDSQTPVRLASAALGFVTVLAAHQLARRGRNRASIAVVVVLATALIIVTAIILRPVPGTRALYYLTVIGIFAGLFLSFRAAIVVFMIHIG
ncbi:MAG: hypothetical protein K8I30_16220, partial [Anaerolineae bacterium]|nr:hypothetical protein [Anaerolineae bacterium]